MAISELAPSQTHPWTQVPPCGVPLLDLERENGPLRDVLLQAMASVVDGGRFVLGAECAQLEAVLAERCGVAHAIGCASGSDALLLSLMAMGIGPGDEVLVPSFTFFATASAVWRLGARPVFVDITSDTFHLDPEQLEGAVSGRTRAMIPVHLFGQCADMGAIGEFARKHQLVVIEDCAQSIDARWGAAPAGSLGLAGCFSFYPTKNLGGCGDGGMITTNDSQLADRLRLLRGHGMQPRYHHQVVGINSRLDTLQAAWLLAKLPYLDEWTRLRCSNAQRYTELFTARGLTAFLQLPCMAPGGTAVWNQYTVRVRDGQRDALRTHLQQSHIGTEIYYPLPLHLQPCFASLEAPRSRLKVTERVAGEVLSLPIFPGLTPAEQSYVVEAIASFFLGA